MMPDIKSKLATEINNNFDSELPIVYILSRIRKLLEIERLKNSFPILNFYCNWTLHSEIDNTDNLQVNSMLLGSINGSPLDFLNHDNLRLEINKFLKQEGLPEIVGGKWNDFKFYLGKVISDTPLTVKNGKKKYIINFLEPLNKEENGFSVGF